MNKSASQTTLASYQGGGGIAFGHVRQLMNITQSGPPLYGLGPEYTYGSCFSFHS